MEGDSHALLDQRQFCFWCVPELSSGLRWVSNAFQQETNVEIKRQLQWMLAEVQWTLAAVQEQLALEFQPALFSVERNAVPVRSFCPFSSASAQIITAQHVASPPGLSASDRYSLGCLQGQSKQTQTDKGYRDSWVRREAEVGSVQTIG